MSVVAMLGIATVAGRWSALVALLVLGGLANAFAQPAANMALAQGIRAGRQGLAFGVKQSAIPVATLLAGVAVPVFAVALGWRWAFVAAAVLAVLVVATVPSLAAPARREPGAGRLERRAVPALAVLAVAGALGAAAANAMGVFMVDAAVDSGWGEGAAGTLLSAGSLAGLTVRLVVGWAIDRRQGWGLAVVAGLMACGSAGFLLLGNAAGTPVLYTLGAVVAFGAGWGWPGLFHFSVVHAHRRAPATATGFVQTGVFTGGIFGPMAFGYLADGRSYAVAWAVGGVALLVAALGVGTAAYLEHLRLR
jgi:MFS family permease